MAGDTYYYYTVVATNAGIPTLDDFEVAAESRVFGLSIETLEGKDWIWRQVPLHMKRLDSIPKEQGGGEGDLEKWVTVMGCWLNLERGRRRALLLKADDSKAPYPHAQLRNRDWGVEPDGEAYDFSVARRFNQRAAHLFQVKGTCPGLQEVVKIYTGWDSTCIDYASTLQSECQDPLMVSTYDGFGGYKEYVGEGEASGGTVVAPPPDEGNIVAIAYRSGPFWQDFAKTIPATIPGQTVRVWEVAGGDLVSTGAAHGVLAFGGGINFNADNIHYTSTHSASGVFSLYADVDVVPGLAGPSNICVCSSSAELSTFIQPYAGGAQSAFGIGGTYPTPVSDEPVERVRGMSCNNTSSTIFAGSVESAVTTAVGSISNLRIGCSNPGWYFRGTVRCIVLRNVADAAPMRTAYRQWIPTQAPQTTMKLVFALHVEGNETLDGAAAAAVATFHATHADTPITLCANPQSYQIMAAATATARYTALLGVNDELAVHTHGQYAWVTALGVTPRTLETYASAVTPSGTGYDVSMDNYTLAESTTLFDGVADLFQAQGFPRPTTHLAGGYMMDADNKTALVAAGYARDISTVPPSQTSAAYIGAGYGFLQGKLAAEYVGVDYTTQPVLMGGLIRMTSSGSVLTYNSLTVAKDRISRSIIAGRGSSFVNVEGEHLGAAEVAGMESFITWIKNYCIERGVSYQGVRANQVNP